MEEDSAALVVDNGSGMIKCRENLTVYKRIFKLTVKSFNEILSSLCTVYLYPKGNCKSSACEGPVDNLTVLYVFE